MGPIIRPVCYHRAMLECVEVNPPETAVGSVIWLHGLGADGHDFEPLVPELKLDRVLPLRFVFPHAPVRPVTLNGGYPMRAWFDLYQLDREARVDLDGVRAARESVMELIEREEANGTPPERVVLAGFSQGGSLALAAGLGHPRRLAGIVALSCWLPRAFATVSEAQLTTPVFLAHGTEDSVVSVAYGRDTRRALDDAGLAVEWREYLMAHQVCATEVADIRAFLMRVFDR